MLRKNDSTKLVVCHDDILIGNTYAVYAFAGIRRFAAMKIDADIARSLFGFKLFDYGVYSWLDIVSYCLADITQRTLPDLLADHLAIIAHTEIERTMLMFIQHGSNGGHALLQLRGRFLKLDGLAFIA